LVRASPGVSGLGPFHDRPAHEGASHPGTTAGWPGAGMVVVALLSVYAGLLAWGAWCHSPAFDEVGHLASGLSHWKLGHFALYRVNPPLVRTWAALPVLLAAPPMRWDGIIGDPLVREEFPVGKRLILACGPEYFRLMTLARWACLPIGLLGAFVCYRWARDLYGLAAGITALIMWCFCPNVLAYGQLIVPDMGGTAFGVAAHYLYWHHLRRPSWVGAVSTGVAFGLMQLTKMTWVIAFALWPILYMADRWARRHEPDRPGLVKTASQLGAILLLGVLVINAGYLFEGSFKRLGDYQFSSWLLKGPIDSQDPEQWPVNRFKDTLVGRVLVPLPESYVYGIDSQRKDFEVKFPSYLRGEWRVGGWWYYYLYALVIKLPIGTWLLVYLAAISTAAWPSYRTRWFDDLFLLTPALAVLGLVSSQTGFNHHIRYVLPILPFAFVWSSKVARAFPLRDRLMQGFVTSSLLWSVGSSLMIYPHSMSYFNELVGGPAEGHAHLVNSNVDWGQDLYYVKRWVDRHPHAQPLYLAYSLPIIDPKMLGINYETPPRDPRPGWYMISVNQIHGEMSDLDYLLRLEPVDRIGYSMLVYQLSAAEANRVRAERALPPFEDPQRSRLR
jgi:hypothetical protein